MQSRKVTKLKPHGGPKEIAPVPPPTPLGGPAYAMTKCESFTSKDYCQQPHSQLSPVV